MATQSEAELETKFYSQLVSIGYQKARVTDEHELLQNLKTQLERLNNITLSSAEFAKVLNHLNKGGVFSKAKALRDRFLLHKDDGDTAYLIFFDEKNAEKNSFQVTQQVTILGTYKNRYDVTLLINGLPLLQVELKRRGADLKSAFEQIQRYQKVSYGASHGLFQYVQVFVISNGINTRYYANNRKQTSKQTFFWTDKNNTPVNELDKFTSTFLKPTHLWEMISQYIVLAEVDKVLMILRPYQYFAVKAIIKQIQDSNENGYIWHTTGSGKTLTSFKASQLIMKMPEVKKVVFVVDRKDLDYQTTKEFNSFSEGSVDGTDNTKQLVKQFGNDTKLIVTTIQKLNNAIESARYAKVMEPLQQERIVFVFDECHRSQFGQTHAAINKYFANNQMIGFTGTPIFADNASKNAFGKRTTKDLFGKCLHKYVITNAIKDGNVLKFAVEYAGRYKDKTNSDNYIDVEVEDVDTTQLFNSQDRIEKITNYIIANHARKTHGKYYTGMFCVSSTENLIKYYQSFKRAKEEGRHNLKIATIYSYAANEDDPDADGIFDEVLPNAAEPEVSYTPLKRESLDSFIGDYNKTFGTAFSTKESKSFYQYYNDIAKRVKNREIDILLVVNMFLTGFDSKPLNTLYVDKNLKYHGLIQAYSRTNRVLDHRKSHGNIIVFRNLKQHTDDALALFSNVNAKEDIFVPDYEVLVEKFINAYRELLDIAATPKKVDTLESEDEELEFVRSFRELMRIRNEMHPYTDFDWGDLSMPEQQFEDFKSKYLDIRDKNRNTAEKTKDSILDDVDFEVELIHRDEINVKYILLLLEQLKEETSLKVVQDKKKRILDSLAGDVHLRSKKELIEKFIEQHLFDGSTETVEDAFATFWEEEKHKVYKDICSEEDLDEATLEKVVAEHEYHGHPIQRDDISKAMKVKPKLLERKTKADRIISRIKEYLEVFVEHMVA